MEAKSFVISLSCSAALKTFIKAVGDWPYRQKSIFPSELFLFYLQALGLNEDDLILESGVGFGGSTRMLSQLFPKTTIASVDNDSYGQLHRVRKDLSSTKRVTIIKGDSTELLPVLLKRAWANKIAVLIDGPKKMQAVCLASKMLKDSRVQFVAVHDLPPDMHRLGDFHSWDSRWYDAHGFLDDRVGEQRGNYPKGPGLTLFYAKHH